MSGRAERMIKFVNMYFNMLIKLSLAVILGGVVGYEREHRSSPAGLRTHILVCIGAAIVQITAFDFYLNHKGEFNTDPMRLGAQVISGIGFLGAGTIIKEGANIRGLTTAASLWAVACIGLTIGTGLYIEAVAATIFIYGSLEGLKRIEKKISRKKRNTFLQVTIENKTGRFSDIGNVFGFMGIEVLNLESKRDANNIIIKYDIKVPEHISNEVLMEKAMLQDGVLGVKIL
jgi:putative Mg2+ transporter-C (MgtC) family protein